MGAKVFSYTDGSFPLMTTAITTMVMMVVMMIRMMMMIMSLRL